MDKYKDFEKYGEMFETLMNKYPNILDKKTPIALLKVHSRVYSNWILEGIVPAGNTLEGKKGWIKLNLYDYVWIMIVKTLRNFGLSIKDIVELKGELFKSFLDESDEDIEGYITDLKNRNVLSEEEIEEQKKLILFAKENRNDIPEEYKILQYEIAALVNSVLVHGDDVSLLVFKNDKKCDYGVYSPQTMKLYENEIKEWLYQPHIHIPLKRIVYEFLEDPENEVNLEGWGFINRNEKKVLEALRGDDFTEIIIRPDVKGKDLVIEKVKDGEIRDKQAKEVRRLLGLNQYSEVTIKYRNDKHLYFKNKTRL